MIKYKGEPQIHTIVLHNTAVSRRTQPLQFNAVNNHHRNKWGDQSAMGYYIGYNFFCEPTGKRTQTRLVGEETIAQVGNNCDIPARCGMVSYCMAGYFKVEKPTQMQVDDFISFIREIQVKYPNVKLKQHKDIQPGRSCAELSNEEIQKWLTDPTVGETPEEKIIRLEAEVNKLTKDKKLLISMVHTLIGLITKK